MNSSAAIQQHLGLVTTMTDVQYGAAARDRMHAMTNCFFEFGLFCGLMMAPLTFVSLIELGDGSVNPILAWMATGFGVLWGSYGGLARFFAKRVGAHPHQWNGIIDHAKAIVEGDPERAELINSVMALMGDSRVTYKWAADLEKLMETLRNSDDEARHQRQLMECLNVATNKAYNGAPATVNVEVVDVDDQRTAVARHINL